MWLEGWEYRQKLTITETSGSDLTDYPVEIVLNTTHIDFTQAKSNGEDIRFTDEDGNVLSYYIESWDSSTETATVHVKMDLTASGTKDIYLYWGNASASDTSTTDIFTWGYDAGEDGMDYISTGGDVTIAGDTGKYEAWPSIARDSSGNLYVVYRTANTNTHAFESSGKLVMKKSTDGGTTWGSEIVVHDTAGQDDRNGAILIYTKDDGTERILVLFDTEVDASGLSYAYSTYSDDYGASWSPAVALYPDESATRGKPIRMSNGNILAPVYCHDGVVREASIISTDDGDSWTTYPITTGSAYTYNEFSVIEMKTAGSYAGHIYALMRRADGASLDYAISTDYGQTWTVHGDSGIVVSDDEPAELWRDSEGTDYIYAVHSTGAGGEIWESTDECSTWKFKAYYAGKRAYRTYERYYPSMAKIDDDYVGVAWCTNEGWSDILFTKMPLPIRNKAKMIRYNGSYTSSIVSESVGDALELQNTTGSDENAFHHGTVQVNGTETPVELVIYGRLGSGEGIGFTALTSGGEYDYENWTVMNGRVNHYYITKDHDSWYYGTPTEWAWVKYKFVWTPSKMYVYEDDVLKISKTPSDGNGVPDKDMFFSLYTYANNSYFKLVYAYIKQYVTSKPTTTTGERGRLLAADRNLSA